MVDRILLNCPGVSRESVLQKLEAERSRAGGLISDEALLRMIAAGFGCELLGGEAASHVLLVKAAGARLSGWLAAALYGPRGRE